MLFEDDGERILDNLLKALSQTEKGLYKIINYIVKVSSKNRYKQCSCKKYFIPKERYTKYTTQANSLKILVEESIALKVFSDDLTGRPKLTTSQILLKKSSNETFNTKPKICYNINNFLKGANKIIVLSCDPQTFVSQMLTFLDLIHDILISICSLKQCDTEIEILSGILVADVYSLYDKYISLWHELNRIVVDPDEEKPIIHSNKCKKPKLLLSLFSELKEYISRSLNEICKVKFYYNDFVIFVEGFKFKKYQEYRYLLKSEIYSSTVTQSVLSKEIFNEYKRTDSKQKIEDSVLSEFKNHNKPTNLEENSKGENITNINCNGFDFVNLKLFDNKLIADKNIDIEKDKRLKNSVSDRDKSITYGSPNPLNISINSDEIHTYNESTVEEEEENQIKSMKTLFMNQNMPSQKSKADIFNLIKNQLTKIEKIKSSVIECKDISVRKESVLDCNLTNEKQKLENPKQEVMVKENNCQSTCGSVSLTESDEFIRGNTVNSSPNVLVRTSDHGQTEKKLVEDIFSVSSLQNILQIKNSCRNIKDILQFNIEDNETDLFSELHVDNFKIIKVVKLDKSSQTMNSLNECVIHERYNHLNKNSVDVATQVILENISLVRTSDHSKLQKKIVDEVEDICRISSNTNIEKSYDNTKHIILQLDKEYKVNKQDLFSGTNIDNCETKEMIKVDKSSQTISNSSKKCRHCVSRKCVFKNNVNVSTQVILESIDASSQTISCPTLLGSSQGVSIPSNVSLIGELLNNEEQNEKKEVNKTVNSKWPVSANYIPFTNRSKIKENIPNLFKRNCEQKVTNLNNNKELKPNKRKRLSRANNFKRHFIKKNVAVDIVKEPNKCMHFLNPNYISANLPFNINSYQLGLSNIVIEHFNNYKTFPDELQNTVSLRYFQPKGINDRNEMNLKSLVSMLTANNAVNTVTNNMLFTIKNKSSKIIESVFGEKQTIKDQFNVSCFRLFDMNGYPLTDYFGNVLKGPYGHSVINIGLLRTSRIIVYDASLTPSTSFNFNPYLKPASNNIGIKLTMKDAPLLLFDNYGRPLTDSSGWTLANNEGGILVQFNNTGYPVSDYKGGVLYTEKGMLWSRDGNKETVLNRDVEIKGKELEKESDVSIENRSGNISYQLNNIDLNYENVMLCSSRHEKDETFNKDIERKEEYLVKRTENRPSYISDIIEPQIIDTTSVEWIKAKIEEPLPIIDDIDLSLGIKLQSIKESKSSKSLSITKQEIMSDITVNGDSNLCQEKEYKKLDILPNYKLDLDLYKKENSKPEVLDEATISKVVESIFSIDWDTKSSQINYFSKDLNKRNCSKTSNYKCLSICDSLRFIQNSKVDVGIEREIRSNNQFNIGRNKYYNTSLDIPSIKELNINKFNNYLDSNCTSKIFDSNSFFCNSQTKCSSFSKNSGHNECMKNDAEYKSKTNKLLDNTNSKEYFKEKKILKEISDMKSSSPRLKTKRKTQVKYYQTKDKQNRSRTNNSCDRPNTMKHIHFGDETNSTKSTVFTSCFHAPVQFLLGKLDATFLRNHKDIVVKEKNYNSGEKLSIYTNKQKVNDRRKTKNKRTQHEKSLIKIIDSKQCKKSQSRERKKLKQDASFGNKHKGDFQEDFHYDKYKCKTGISMYGKRFDNGKRLYNGKYHRQANNSQLNHPSLSYKNSGISLDNESNITHLIQKYTKTSIPTKILNSPKPSPYSSLKELNFSTPAKNQCTGSNLFDSLEENNYFHNSLKTLNTTFVDDKYCETTNGVN